nr:MAG TPA: hypothetical protein [Caudoviricetes sp.]
MVDCCLNSSLHSLNSYLKNMEISILTSMNV